jgi:cytochrome c oxidase assembly protein subunit 15
MLHRYAASLLGLAILVLFFLAIKRKTGRPQSLGLPAFTALFVKFFFVHLKTLRLL